MDIKFSEHVIPLADLKVNPGKIVNRAKETNTPVLVTSRGRGVAVVQGLEDYEKDQEALLFMKAVIRGLMEVKEGKMMELDEVKKKLGLD
jgi:prevent-host-death family protein